MAKRLFLVFSVLVSLVMATSSVAAAQSSTPVVQDISDLVIATDSQDILAGLEEVPRDRTLPEGFSDAVYRDISDATTPEDDDCLYDASDLAGTEGAAAYSLTADVEGLGYPYVCASINYVIFEDDQLGDDPLGDFKTGIEQGLGDTAEGTPDAQGGLAEVIDITVADEDAVLLTYTLDQDGTSVVVQTLALPVGNVFVITLVSAADTATVDASDIEAIADELTIAGIDHLGTVVEAAQ